MLILTSTSFVHRSLTATALCALSLGAFGCGSSKCDEASLLHSYMGTGETCSGGAAGSGGNAGEVASAGKGASAGEVASAGKGGTTPNGGTLQNACEAYGAESTDEPPPEEAAGEPVTVYEWGQPDNEALFDTGDWDLDSAHGAAVGATALHPPALSGKDDATLTLDCEGEEHTQLSFGVVRAADDVELELYVDGKRRGLVSAGFNWSTMTLLVPPGAHAYELVARNVGSTKTETSFVVDNIVCERAEPGAGRNMIVDFDDGFVPVEQSGWLVDNLRGIHEGEAALHPPALKAGDQSAMTFDCGRQEHTQLSFVVVRSTDNVELELCDGKVSRGLVGVGFNWFQLLLNVPEGRHNYTMIARNTGTTDVAGSYILDTFACAVEAPASAHNGFVDSDDDFIPVEFGGDWFVDNMRGIHEGEAAVHPPTLTEGAEATLTVDCGERTSGLELVVHRTVEDAELELFDRDGTRGLVGAGYNWARQVFEGGGPKYTFVARNTGTKPITEAFVLDTFQCK